MQFWYFNLCSSFIKFNHVIDKLKCIFYENSYWRDLVDTSIAEFLEKVLAAKTIVTAILKSDLVIALPYLAKLFLQIRPRKNWIMENKLPYANLQFVSRLPNSVNILSLKREFPRSFVLVLFIDFSLLATFLLIIAKLNVIFRSECVDSSEFWHSLVKEWKAIKFLSLKDIFYYPITHPPDFEYFSILSTNKSNFKVAFIESLLINL